MLQKEQSKRATLDEMMSHPWTTEGGTTPCKAMSDMEKVSITASDRDIKRAVTELAKISNLVQAKLAAGLFKKKSLGRMKEKMKEKMMKKKMESAKVGSVQPKQERVTVIASGGAGGYIAPRSVSS